MSVQSINSQFLNSQIAQKPKRYPWQAVASFVIPGTGQFIKGDKKKGRRDLGIQIGLVVAAFFGGMALGALEGVKTAKKSLDKTFPDFESFTKKSAGFSALVFILGSASLVNKIHSAYDAYKAAPVKES